MPEQSERTIEVDLSAPLLQIVTPIEEHAEDMVLRTVRRALTMEQSLDALELAHLTDTLVTHCASLAEGIEAMPNTQRPVRGQGALRDWAQLQADGPGDGPLGPWSYARQLAVVARSMVTTFREYRATSEARSPYVGRRDLPPLTPTAP